MNNSQELHHLFDELIASDKGTISINGSNITVQLVDDANRMLCSTPVFNGGNYIPKSVRACVDHPSPIRQSIRTQLEIDEESFQVKLLYLGKVDYFDCKVVKGILHEFSNIAEEWRYYLDEHGRQDLVHVIAK